MKHYKLTDELAAKMQEAIAKMAPVAETIKEATETGTFEVVISTADQDRQGEIVLQDGWNLDRYKQNPVVLWAHDYSSLPVGICETLEVVNGNLTAKGRFASAEANPFAQQVRRLYDAGLLRATSVGFIPLQMDGNVITQAELLEFSFVPVPANPFALSLREAEAMQLDIAELTHKGFHLAEKDGDVVITDAPEEPKEETQDEQPAKQNIEEQVAELKGQIAQLREMIKEFSAQMAANVDEPKVDLPVPEEPPIEPEPVDGATVDGEAEAQRLNTFIAERAALKAVAGAVSDALARMNTRAREHYRKR